MIRSCNDNGHRLTIISAHCSSRLERAKARAGCRYTPKRLKKATP